MITGHLAGQAADLCSKLDFASLARLEGTLVFLMGFGQLRQIADGLIHAGKEAATPAAVVHGTFDASVAVVRGTLADIAEKAAEAAMQAPAVIIVGRVAALGGAREGCMEENTI